MGAVGEQGMGTVGERGNRLQTATHSMLRSPDGCPGWMLCHISFNIHLAKMY